MRFENLIPVLDVKDVETSIRFYCDVLGFRVCDKVEWGGKTEWAQLSMGYVQLMLSAAREEDVENATRGNEGVFFLYLDNIDALHVYLGSRGYDPMPDLPGSKASGKDFYLRDPDGYVLWFSHRFTHSDDDEDAVESLPDSETVIQAGHRNLPLQNEHSQNEHSTETPRRGIHSSISRNDARDS